MGNGFIPGRSIRPIHPCRPQRTRRTISTSSSRSWQATIQSNSPGIELLQASSGYPNLEAGVAATNATPLAYRVPKTIACGTPITFTCVASANGFLFTNTFSRVVGQFTVTNVVRNDYESAAVPRPIPDGGSVVSGLEITNLGKVASMNV